MLMMASWPALAVSDGIGLSFIKPRLHLICHPCHYYEESFLNSNTKRFSKLNGKGGNPPVQGVLGKIDFSTPSDPLIKVLADV